MLKTVYYRELTGMIINGLDERNDSNLAPKLATSIAGRRFTLLLCGELYLAEGGKKAERKK